MAALGRTSIRVAVMLVALMSLVAGCTLGPSQRPPLATDGTGPAPATARPSDSPPTGPGGVGQQAEPLRWGPCGDVDTIDPDSGLTFTVDCATVIPVGNSSNNSGRQVTQVARARVSGLPDDAPAVVVLRGQPGEYGRSRVAAAAAGVSAGIREHFAIITVDLMGTGGSGLIDCLSGYDTGTLVSLGSDPRKPAVAAALAGLSRSVTFECGDLVGPDLTRVNSTLAADDLDALRSALGSSALTLIGRGFGATLAAVYADRYPGHVSAGVLDAPADPRQDPVARATDTAVAAEKALDAFAAACAGFAGGCPLGADPRNQVAKAVNTLDAAGGARPGSGETTGGSVLLTLLLRLGEPGGWPALATALAAAATGHPTPVASLLRQSLGLDTAGWLAAAIVYGCNDTALRILPDQLTQSAEAAAALAPLFGPFTVGLVGICASWPAPETALGGLRAQGAPPLLVLGATGDPQAPYSAVRSLTAQLSSATLLSWQATQHGSYPASVCVTTAVETYLVGQQPPPAVGTLCPP